MTPFAKNVPFDLDLGSMEVQDPSFRSSKLSDVENIVHT